MDTVEEAKQDKVRVIKGKMEPVPAEGGSRAEATGMDACVLECQKQRSRGEASRQTPIPPTLYQEEELLLASFMDKAGLGVRFSLKKKNPQDSCAHRQ